MNRQVLLFGRARKRERMPLPVRHRGAVDHDVLARAHAPSALFANVQLDDLVRVVDDFADEGAVARANLAEQALRDVEEPAERPAERKRSLVSSGSSSVGTSVPY